MKKQAIYFTAIFLVISFIAALSSCGKPERPKAVITVLDEQSNPVEGASVTVTTDEGNVVYFSTGAKFSETSLTNAAGQTSYEFQYEAIYNVKVVKLRDYTAQNERQGAGVLILKEGKTCQERIRIR